MTDVFHKKTKHHSSVHNISKPNIFTYYEYQMRYQKVNTINVLLRTKDSARILVERCWLISPTMNNFGNLQLQNSTLENVNPFLNCWSRKLGAYKQRIDGRNPKTICPVH